MTCLHLRVPTSVATRPLLPGTQTLTLEQDLVLQVRFLVAMALLFLSTHQLTRISTLTFFSFIHFCKMMLSKFFFHAILYYLFWDIDCTPLIPSVQFFSLETVRWTILGFFGIDSLTFFFPQFTAHFSRPKPPKAGILSIFVGVLTWLEAATGSFMITPRASLDTSLFPDSIPVQSVHPKLELKPVHFQNSV